MVNDLTGEDMEEKVNLIPARLRNCALDGHVAGASDIIDDKKGKTQNVINAETDESIGEINTAIGDDSTEGSIKGRLKEVEDIIGSGGAIDERIAAAVNALDSEVSHNSEDGKVSIAVTETDGKLTKVVVTTNDIASAATVVQNKQDSDSDIASINSKIVPEASAANKLIDKKYVDDALSTEQTRAIAAEETIANNIFSETTRAQGIESTLQTAINDEITRAKAAEKANTDSIDAIEGKIPSQASVQNKLADKEFVNSSISTATATFRGTYSTLEELQAVSADNNDYGFVRSQDAEGNTIYTRYKYDGTQWSFEYSLNNSSFTSEQWAAISSGLTSDHKNKLDTLPTNAELTEVLGGKQPVISDLENIRSGAQAGSTAYQKPSEGIPESDLDSSTQSKINAGSIAYHKPQEGIPSSDMAQEVQESLHKADTAIQEHQSLGNYYNKTEVNELLDGKQNTIDDLQSIREGAEAGSNAYQKPEGNIPYSDLSSGVQALLDKANAAAPQETTYNKDEVNSALAGKQNALTFDDVPTENSSNPVKSGGIYSALSGKQDTIINLQEIINGANAGAKAYQLPPTGIPENDLTSELKDKINSGGNAYTKPDDGIPASDMTQEVQKSLRAAGTAVQPLDLNDYQEKLVSGTNIKTVNGNSVLGSGNITISTTGVAYDSSPEMDGKASSGTTNAYARGDHRHPSDTSKANVAELIIADGTGDDSDKVTIQLKNGLSTIVLKSHQDISGLQEKLDFATSQECITAAKELT